MFRYEPRRRHRRAHLVTALLLGGLLSPPGAEARIPLRWTLREALDTAFTRSPVLRARQAELAEVESGLLGAKTYPYNPELTLEVADRRGPGTATTDRGLSLSQELEIAGQRRQRVIVASERSAAAATVFLHQKRLLAFRVESAFAEAVRARELLSVAEIDAALARNMLGFSTRRLERGAATQIEVNLARASAGRAERSLQAAKAIYASARGRLAELAGIAPASQPEPLGELSLPKGELPPVEELLARAFEQRGDLNAVQRREKAAEASVRLSLAERRPNLKIGGFLQREETTDDIFGATISVSLPVFDRNQGRIAESRAFRERLRHEHDALRLAVERQVVAALSDLRAALNAAENLRDQVLGNLEDNVNLLQRSFAAGRIGATEVMTLRREFVAVRRELIEAQADAWLARVNLDLAAGRLPSSPHTEGLP